MKNKILFTATLILCLGGGFFQTSSAQSLTVHTIGDSTMTNQDEETSNKRGWAQMFQQFFNNEITVNNRAKSGASSKSFYKETGYWNSVKTQIKAGDYVFVQFGHNDEKNNGKDGDEVIAELESKGESTAGVDYRGTTASGTYREYLRSYINESRNLGATPILLTPICRKYFDGKQINRRGRHDLGEYFSVGESDHTYDYAYATKTVAEELDVPVIDLTTLTKDLYESYGEEACTNLIFCTADDKGNVADGTHPSPLGATLIARLCAQEMVRMGILADKVNASADLLINPSDAYDFGTAYIGQTVIKEFSIAGFDLTPVTGNITLAASEGFSIASEKNGNYDSVLTLNYANSNLDYTRFYVKCVISAKEEIKGTLTVANPDNSTLTKTIGLTVKGLDLSGGTEVSVLWPLTDNNEYTQTGPATVIDQTLSNMIVQGYKNPGSGTIWPEESGYTDGRKTQRCCITGEEWPAGEIDEVSDRYIEFGIQANTGTKLDIDSIGLYVTGCGGNGMCCHIAYSTDQSFSNCKYIYQASNMKNKNMVAVEAIPVVALEAGEILYLRIYPWYNGKASGKTICLSDVYIHGYASEGGNYITEHLITDENSDEIALERKVIYDISGRRVAHPTDKGIYIVNGEKMILQ